jgi:hypothetical protein
MEDMFANIDGDGNDNTVSVKVIPITPAAGAASLPVGTSRLKTLSGCLLTHFSNAESSGSSTTAINGVSTKKFRCGSDRVTSAKKHLTF